MNRKGIVARTLTLGLFSSFGLLVSFQSLGEPQKIVVPPGQPTGIGGQSSFTFGESIDIDGDTMVIGDSKAINPANFLTCGAAYVYRRIGGVWTFEARLEAHDPWEDDKYGISVAVSGDRIIVGASSADHETAYPRGAVYFYERSGNSWSFVGKEAADEDPDRTLGGNEEFGRSVDIDGPWAIVGSHRTTAGGHALAGKAYIYHWDDSGGGSWGLYGDPLTAFTPPAPQDTFSTCVVTGSVPNSSFGEWFGFSVAIKQDSGLFPGLIAVGAPFADTGNPSTGGVYVYKECTSASPVQWNAVAFLESNYETVDNVGWSVDVFEDFVVTGAIQNGKKLVPTGPGFVDVYWWDYLHTMTGEWTREAHLVPADGVDADLFGYSVSLDNDRLLVGAPKRDYQDDGGKVYGYARDINANWLDWNHLGAHDEELSGSEAERFGEDVSLHYNSALGNFLLAAGANADDIDPGNDVGSVYMYFGMGTTCHSDLNYDGDVDGADLGILFGNWGNPGLTDLNNDGTTDGQDSGLLLGQWGLCP